MTEQKTVSVDELLAQRGTTHGEYTEHARCTQAILDAMMRERTWPSLPPIIRETVHMIAHKLGRIATGNPFVADHYDDIAGYARLVSQRVVDGVGLASGHEFRSLIDQGRDLGLSVNMDRAHELYAELTAQEPAPEEGDLWSDVAARWGVSRREAKERGLAMLFDQPSPAQRTMAADMAESRPAPRIELPGPGEAPVLIDGTGTRVKINDPVYINGRSDMGHLRAIKDHPNVAEPLLVEFGTGTVHSETLWAPLRGTVYARQARALQEPQERFRTERRVPRYSDQLDPPLPVAVETTASAAAPTPARAEPSSPGSPEDGGHHGAVEDDSIPEEALPFSSEIRREQRELTWKEWSDLGGQLVGHGSMLGSQWRDLYLAPGADGNHTDRYLMIPALQDEYAR